MEQHLGSLGHARPFEDLLYHVYLRLLVALWLRPAGIIAMVHVLSPYALPQRRGLIIEARYALVEGALCRQNDKSKHVIVKRV